MSYNNYTIDNVFTEPRLNAMCDFLLEKIEAAFPVPTIFERCILSGKASAILQGDAGNISNVTFEVDADNIYLWLVQNVGSTIFKCKQITYKNRILFYPQPDLYFEIWLKNTPLTPVLINRVYVQDITEIPSETL